MPYIKNKILINFFIILLFIFLLEGMICQPEIGRWNDLVVVTENIKFTNKYFKIKNFIFLRFRDHRYKKTYRFHSL